MKGTNLLIPIFWIFLVSLGVQGQVNLPKSDDAKVNFPKPVLNLTGKELTQIDGEIFYRYRLSVTNYRQFPDALFKASPELAACGENTKASRTWVTLFELNTNKKLNGFCAFNSADDLTKIWFPVKQGNDLPDCVYLSMTDRKLKKTVLSNKVCLDKDNPDNTSTRKADLKIRQFQFPSSSNSALRVQIANYGDALAKASVLRLTIREIDGQSVGRTIEIEVPALAGGKTDWILIEADDILPRNVKLKDTVFKLNVDVTQKVSESDETNNEAWHNNGSQ